MQPLRCDYRCIAACASRAACIASFTCHTRHGLRHGLGYALRHTWGHSSFDKYFRSNSLSFNEYLLIAGVEALLRRRLSLGRRIDRLVLPRTRDPSGRDSAPMSGTAVVDHEWPLGHGPLGHWAPGWAGADMGMGH